MPASHTVAIIGASNDRRKYGNKAVRAYLAARWTVFPVNPHESAVEGLTAFRSLEDLPEAPSAVALYVPATVGVKLLPSIAHLQPRELWINPGAESAELAEQVRILNLPATYGCAILSLGLSPRQFPDA